MSDPTGVAVDPNGGRLYVANDNFPVSTVTVIDAATGATVAAIPTAAQNTNSIATGGVAVSPDGKKVYALNTGTDAIRVIDTATNAIITTITGRAAPCFRPLSATWRRRSASPTGSRSSTTAGSSRKAPPRRYGKKPVAALWRTHSSR